jgi:acarbose 7IV-phosphotransferase
MKKILVSGHTGIEITAKIRQFPIEYTPIEYEFDGIDTTISSVGYNIVKAIKTLGGDPIFFSVIGNDIYRDIIKNEIENMGINTEYILPIAEKTSQSVILYNKNKRKIICDLKNVQEIKYPIEKIDEIIDTVDIAILCNINYSRELLKKVKSYGKTIATDVHVLDDIDDKYSRDFMAYSDILFLSNENILGREKDFLKGLIETYNNKIIVIGLGENGVLMYIREENKINQYPAVKTRDIVNTIGAGDALFSSFIYFYNKAKDPYYAIEKAIIFASYKIGENGAAQGFLSEEELLKIKAEKHGKH